MAEDVVGPFSIFNSTFFAPFENIDFRYAHCNRPSHFNFSHNTLITLTTDSEGSGLFFDIYCSDVQILITDSTFENNNFDGLNIHYNVLTNNSLRIRDTIFKRAHISIYTCTEHEDCNGNDLRCSPNFINLTRVTFNSLAYFDIGSSFPVQDCTVVIEDSTISSYSCDDESDDSLHFTFLFGYDLKNMSDTSTHAILHFPTSV